MMCARSLTGASQLASSAPAGSPSRPEPRSGRSHARLSRLLPVLALLLGAFGLFAAAPAQAQSTTFVSNVGQTAGSPDGTTSNSFGQGFTTGSNATGYRLSSIEAVLAAANATQRATIRAELWSATTANDPDSKIASLTVPAAVSAGTVAFTAPANTTLSANTNYFFVIYTVGNFNARLGTTESTNEDFGGQTGWSIANFSRYFGADVPTSGRG